MVIKVIGDWPQEIILKSPPYFILENKNNYDKLKVVNHLKSGYPMIDIKEFKTCLFNCGAKGSDIGTREITDGEWIWPEELIHYVEHHYIDLPSEFLLHMKQKNFQVDIPSSLKDELEKEKKVMYQSLTKIKYSHKYWVAWLKEKQKSVSEDRIKALKSQLEPFNTAYKPTGGVGFLPDSW